MGQYKTKALKVIVMEFGYNIDAYFFSTYKEPCYNKLQVDSV